MTSVPSATSALGEIVELLVTIREMLEVHDQGLEFRRFGNLGVIATEGDGTAEERLRRIWRSRMRLDHRDGILDLRILRPDGTQDPAASGELVRLCERLDEVIEEWGPPEKDAGGAGLRERGKLGAIDIARMVKNHFGAHVSQLSLDEAGGVRFVLMDALAFDAHPDDYGSGGNWGFGLRVADTVISELLGRSLTLLSSPEQIEAALHSIDRYVRVRLGAEYVAAFEASVTQGPSA